MKEQVYLYPVWVRLWHLFNAILFLGLIFTGLCLQYSSEDYTIIPFKYAVSIHNITGFILVANYLYFIFGNLLTRNGRYYQFHRAGMINRLLKQFRYYSFGIFKKEDPPFPITKKRKFNPLQKFSYVVVMYFFLPVIVGTGIAMFFPEVLPSKLFGFSGIHLIDLIHIITGFVLSVFLIVHVYFCTIGKTPSANFKSMINGWH
jgi:thiosulfate reductase cytochrome b subunit